MKKIAVICFENPFNKPRRGGKNDMKTRIIALSAIPEVEIDVYLFNHKGEETAVPLDYAGLKILNCYQYALNRISIRALISKWPVSVYRRMNSDCINEMKQHAYDVAIYEGEHTSLYRFCGQVNANKHILRQHDIESSYRKELSKSSATIAEGLAQLIEGMKYERLESSIDKVFDEILFISNEEKEIFASKFSGSQCRFTYLPPSTMKFSNHIASGTVEKKLLYFGNMELKNNFKSILWFVKKVFSKVIKEDSSVILEVIGKISEKDRIRIERFVPNVKVRGYVDDLEKEIYSAAMIVSPVLYGAGVKVKVIDAISYGQIVVATSKSIEGTNLKAGEHLIVEDNPQKQANRILDILYNRAKYYSVMTRGLEYVKTYHSIDFHGKILENAIEEGK